MYVGRGKRLGEMRACVCECEKESAYQRAGLKGGVGGFGGDGHRLDLVRPALPPEPPSFLSPLLSSLLPLLPCSRVDFLVCLSRVTGSRVTRRAVAATERVDL